MTHTIFVPLVATPGDHSNESTLLNAVLHSHLQQRPLLRRNDILMQVAQRRVNDMIRRAYFAHIDPDGYGPNHHARQAGFALPAYYSQRPDANNIESLAAGQATVAEVWEALQASYGHKAHLFGIGSFYYRQTELGVGYAFSGASKYTHYYCVLIAEQADD